MSEFGELTRSKGYVTATMDRHVGDQADTVWSMLAEESNRVKWLAPGSLDLKPGGSAKLDFKDSYVLVDSTITACEPSKLLEFSWSGAEDPLRPIRFELEEHLGGCKITLAVSIPENEVVARSCAGWEAHLTMMQAVLAGVSIKFPLDRFKACREDFDAQLLTLMMTDMEVLKL